MDWTTHEGNKNKCANFTIILNKHPSTYLQKILKHKAWEVKQLIQGVNINSIASQDD